MKATVPFLVLLSGCCMTWTEALTVKGLVGGTVRIECTYTNAQSNTKYFCKGECRDQDVLITSKTGGSEKYSIEDKGNTFITTMRNLQLKDTGNYRCAIERFGPDPYVEVYLKVNDVEKSDVHAVEEAITTGFKPTARPTDFENESSRGETVSARPTDFENVSSRGESTSDVKSDVHAVQDTTTTEFEPTGRHTDFENESSKGRSISGDLSYQLIYKGAALGVAVLVLALLLLKFCKIKRRSAAFVSDRNQSTNECPGEPRRNSLLPASLTNPRPDSAIYSNVSGFPKPQDQPEESGVALITDTDSVMYSTIDDQN